ncbi:MAG: hypothetical protein L0H79_21115, partial [Intrasporangium sp.]|uniref:hypothetical protein n=1 Tax=Intrasporangium sp. TaxID=1925024 RepID=UPI002649E782
MEGATRGVDARDHAIVHREDVHGSAAPGRRDAFGAFGDPSGERSVVVDGGPQSDGGHLQGQRVDGRVIEPPAAQRMVDHQHRGAVITHP